MVPRSILRAVNRVHTVPRTAPAVTVEALVSAARAVLAFRDAVIVVGAHGGALANVAGTLTFATTTCAPSADDVALRLSATRPYRVGTPCAAMGGAPIARRDGLVVRTVERRMEVVIEERGDLQQLHPVIADILSSMPRANLFPHATNLCEGTVRLRRGGVEVKRRILVIWQAQQLAELVTRTQRLPPVGERQFEPRAAGSQ